MRNGPRRSNLISQTPKFIKPATGAFYFKSNTSLYRSTNGTSWTAVTGATPESTANFVGATTMSTGKFPYVTNSNPALFGVSPNLGLSIGNTKTVAAVTGSFAMTNLGGSIYQKASHTYFVYNGVFSANTQRYILRSTDGGNTYTSIAPGSATNGCGIIAQGSGTELMACGARSGATPTETALLYYSSDNGTNWTARNSPFGGIIMTCSIAYSPSLDMWMAVRGESGSGQVSYSTDDGANWTPVTIAGISSFGNRWRVFWSNVMSSFVLRQVGGATDFWTSPNGTTWTQRTIPSPATSATITNIVENGSVAILHCSDNNFQQLLVGNSVTSLSVVTLPATATNGYGNLSYYDP